MAIFYFRPFDEPYHGASVHLQRLVERLPETFDVEVVGPRRGRPGTGGTVLASSLLGARYLLSALAGALRFQWREALLGPDRRCQVIVGFDVYLSGVAAFWAKLTGTPFLYCPLDSNEAVSRSFVAGRYQGGRWRTGLRGPNERLALSAASAIFVPSVAMATGLKAQGVPESRVKLLNVKRPLPQRDERRIEQWRTKLGLADRPGVLFLGSFLYPPNVQAFASLRKLVQRAFPPQAGGPLFVVAGVGSEAFTGQALANLKVLGPVEDLDGLLFACHVAVAPMDVQGGTSGKIVDYVLHGLPVVATPQATAGVAPSPLLTTAPLQDFEQALRAVVSSTGLGGPHDPDPTYVQQYVEGDDVREFIDTARGLVSSSQERPGRRRRSDNGRSQGPETR